MTPPGASGLELPVDECWALLRSVPVGRIAFVAAGHPEIQPVNHVVDHGTVVFRTEGTTLPAVISDEVALEVDGYDVSRGEAWSVVVHGAADEIRRFHESIVAMSLPFYSWQGGSKPRLVRIEPNSVTGRRFSVVDGVFDRARVRQGQARDGDR